MTPADLAVIGDMLRATGRVSDAQLRRVLFALQPTRFKGEVCAICEADLSTRPVLRTIRYGLRDINKRVHMKPVQVVLASRKEGSHGRDVDVPNVFWRFCGACVATMFEVKP